MPTELTKGIWFAGGDQCANTTKACIGSAIYLPKGDHGVVTVVDVAEPNWEFDTTALNASILTDPGGGNPGYEAAPGRMVQIEFTAGRLEVTLDSTGLADNQAPVSYTHLDVYKRQAQKKEI